MPAEGSSVATVTATATATQAGGDQGEQAELGVPWSSYFGARLKRI